MSSEPDVALRPRSRPTARAATASSADEAALREAAALRTVARADPHGGAKVAQPAGTAALYDSLQDRLRAGTLLMVSPPCARLLLPPVTDD